jgi:hypothetical protein
MKSFFEKSCSKFFNYSELVGYNHEISYRQNSFNTPYIKKDSFFQYAGKSFISAPDFITYYSYILTVSDKDLKKGCNITLKWIKQRNYKQFANQNYIEPSLKKYFLYHSELNKLNDEDYAFLNSKAGIEYSRAHSTYDSIRDRLGQDASLVDATVICLILWMFLFGILNCLFSNEKKK